MGTIDYLKTWLEYSITKVKGEMLLFEIIPGKLYQSSEIREPGKIRDVGIDVVIDLSGGFDKGIDNDNGPLHYHWVRGIEDKAELPDLEALEREISFATAAMGDGLKVLFH